MLETHHVHGAANRIYYACFYAVTALLLMKNLSSHKHSGVMALFNQHFVRTGFIPKHLGQFYSEVFDRRIESDYADGIDIDPQDMPAQLALARQLVQTVEGYIKAYS